MKSRQSDYDYLLATRVDGLHTDPLKKGLELEIDGTVLGIPNHEHPKVGTHAFAFKAVVANNGLHHGSIVSSFSVHQLCYLGVELQTDDPNVGILIAHNDHIKLHQVVNVLDQPLEIVVHVKLGIHGNL